MRLVQHGGFQKRVASFMQDCFGMLWRADKATRAYRFLEESLELGQSLGVTRDEVTVLVEYVYSRPVGVPAQEVGGVEVTLAALCEAHEIDKAEAADVELERIYKPDVMARIRQKQASKPSRSPLPGVADEPRFTPTERQILESELNLYKNALWKACGDNADVVKETLEAVGP